MPRTTKAALQAISATACLVVMSPLVYSQDGKASPSELENAIQDDNAPAVRMLIDAGADVNEPNWLWYAVSQSQGNVEIVKLLVDAGADVNAAMPVPPEQEESVGGLFGSGVDDVSATPLSLAALLGFSEIAEILLDEGANPNVVTGLGTPMGMAAARGYADVVRLLIEAGGDASAENLGASTVALGFRPLTFALKGGHTDAVRLLVEADAYPCPDYSSFPMFDIAYRALLEQLLDEAGNRELTALIDGAKEACSLGD